MKDSLSFLGQLSPEDKLLAGRVIDSIKACEEKYADRFTFFLDEHQQALCRKVLASQCFEGYRFFGGYEGAGRKILGMFAPYSDPDDADFPMTAVSILYRRSDTLTHRDILGCLMSLGINRETLGDIIVSEGHSVVFVYDTVVGAVMPVEKVGRIGVKTAEGMNGIVIPEQRFSEIEGTVASLRLDSVLGLALRISREKAVGLIRSGSVSVNYTAAQGADRKLEEGDVFSVRGYGKFVLAEAGSVTKKDRIHIKVNKYI